MIIGRLGKDPELRNGVTKFSVATDESYTDRNGVRQNVTEWHNIVTFGKTAENCSQYLSKGSLVYVDGKLRTRKWQDQSGQDRYTTEVNADRVQFLDRRQEQEQQEREQPRAITSRPQRQTPPVQQQFSTMEDDGGLPF
jgi:single-strand DNA-binding protein